MGVAEEIAKGTSAIAKWELKIFPILASKQKKRLNAWFDEFEFTFDSSQVRVNTVSGYAGYLTENEFAVKTGASAFVQNRLEFETYKELYRNRIKQLSGKDLTTARLLRNNLAMRAGGSFEEVADQYDEFIKSSLGMNPRTINKIFAEQPAFKGLAGLMDSGGKLWKPDKYFAMYTRTRSGEIADIIMTDEMEGDGLDVVQITDVSTTTPICLQYEGKYFSRFGNTPGLPVLDILPPFHPNCRHSALPVDDRVVTESQMQTANRRVDRKVGASKKKWSPAVKSSIKRQEAWNLKNRSGIGTAVNNKDNVKKAEQRLDRVEEVVA
jgi:hypothetical protein